MGLVFPLQSDLRRSSPETLTLRSSKRRFSLGGTFVFVGALLGTMYLAAAPLFKVFWNEGALFDKAFAAFFYSLIFLYPLAALVCWFYEDAVEIRRQPGGLYHVASWKKALGFVWKKRQIQAARLSELHIENWKGARNVASIKAEAQNANDRYATRGHWILRLRHNGESLDLERRAKRDEIEMLKAQIEAFFQDPPPPPA